MEKLSICEEINYDDVGYHHTSPSSMESTSSGTPLSCYGYNGYCRTSSDTSAFSDQQTDDNNSFCSETSPAAAAAAAALHLHTMTRHHGIIMTRSKFKCGLEDHNIHDADHNLDQTMDSEVEMMKERFAKLLLGEDMSGSGKGVSTALTISNAITNLYATVFGQHLRLEPLPQEKKAMWKREICCLLSVCDYIVEFFTESQTLHDGTTVEVMSSRPRSDLYINLPALQKLDMMLLDILDSFEMREFWYAENGSGSSSSTSSTNSKIGSFRRISLRKEEKWWLPVPCVPSSGLTEKSIKQLRNKRDCANQIHKAAMAINSTILAEMQIPDTYIETLPKSGRASLGDAIYRYMYSAEKFAPERLLNCLNIASEHEALELADRIEASMYTWRRKACLSHSKPSWEMVKDLMAETERSDKNTILAERAENLLLSLKQRFPELSQTTLDTSKIQYNRDVGQAVLESYSRVLEGLAFNIVAWIEDVVFVDTSVRNQQG